MLSVANKPIRLSAIMFNVVAPTVAHYVIYER